MKIVNFEHLSMKNLSEVELDFSVLQWVDINRPVDKFIQHTEQTFHSRHKIDLGNSTHPPSFEQTQDYEILIFRNIDSRFEVIQPKTRSIAFLIIGNTITSVHDEGDNVFSGLFEKWENKFIKKPSDIVSLLHILLDEIGNSFLAIREPLVNQVSEWQRKLLDPNDPFNDWQVIMKAKSSLRALNTNLELQREALLRWRENTRYELSPSNSIRFNDLDSHLARIERLASGISTDLDSLTQIYFASTGQRTNSTMQILAVLSAIFLPLNLIAGIFGMNFEFIPLLKNPWGAAITIGFMLVVSITLLWWFRKKKWF
jgi:magnesium transporter